MELGVNTNLHQGGNVDQQIDLMRRLGIRHVRTGVTDHEKRRLHPGTLIEAGFDVSLTVNRGNYENAEGAGLDTFADDCARYWGRHPGLYAIQIGNEFNRGFAGDIHPRDRAAAHVRQVRAVRERLPDAFIVGGSAHQMPVGEYIQRTVDEGVLELVDAYAVHPYGVRYGSEVIDMIGLVRDVIGKDVRLHCTEYSTYFPTPEVIERHSVSLAAAGVDIAYWYKLLDDRYDRGVFDEGTVFGAKAETFQRLVQAIPKGVERLAAARFRVGGDDVDWSIPGAVADSIIDHDLHNSGEGPWSYWTLKDGTKELARLVTKTIGLGIPHLGIGGMVIRVEATDWIVNNNTAIRRFTAPFEGTFRIEEDGKAPVEVALGEGDHFDLTYRDNTTARVTVYAVNEGSDAARVIDGGGMSGRSEIWLGEEDSTVLLRGEAAFILRRNGDGVHRYIVESDVQGRKIGSYRPGEQIVCRGFDPVIEEVAGETRLTTPAGSLDIVDTPASDVTIVREGFSEAYSPKG